MSDRKWTALVVPAGAVVALGLTRRGRTRDARLVRRSFAAWEAGTGSIFDLMDDDSEILLPGTAPHTGAYRKRAFLDEIADPFSRRFSIPPVPRLLDLWSRRGSVVVSARSEGLTLDDQPYAQDYMFVFTLRRGRIVRMVEFYDAPAFNAVWDRIRPRT